MWTPRVIWWWILRLACFAYIITVIYQIIVQVMSRH